MPIHLPTIALVMCCLLILTHCGDDSRTMLPLEGKSVSMVPGDQPHQPSLVGTSIPQPSTGALPPHRDGGAATDTERTLASLQQIDPHPLYTMTFYGDYAIDEAPPTGNLPTNAAPWACSLFALFADPTASLYGRNFDWDHHPALLLFTHPPGRYAAVSMVDISYLGIDHTNLDTLTTLAGREALLRAPLLPFDGMNEYGLTIAMAAVPNTTLPNNPAMPTIGSLRIIRHMLDQARDTQEALAIFEHYNIDFSGGPPIHYLIADRGGHAAVVELKDGTTQITRSEGVWQATTNFYIAGTSEAERMQDWRYAAIATALQRQPTLTSEDALKLLSKVAQPHTRWSIVYEMANGNIRIAMDRKFDQVYSFHLKKQP